MTIHQNKILYIKMNLLSYVAWGRPQWYGDDTQQAENSNQYTGQACPTKDRLHGSYIAKIVSDLHHLFFR